MKQIVGVTDMKGSNNLEESIIIYSLGPCIGLVIYDPVVKVGGYMLPEPSIDKKKAAARPYMLLTAVSPGCLKPIAAVANQLLAAVDNKDSSMQDIARVIRYDPVITASILKTCNPAFSGLNMACGNALSKTNSQVPFELGIPVMINASEVSENELFTILPHNALGIILTGMPKEAIHMGAVDYVQDIHSIAGKAVSLLQTM